MERHAWGMRPPLLAAVVILYAVQALAVGLTKIPICDEGWYADPAVNLIQHGSMGSPVIESEGGFLRGIDQKTYWILPGYILAQAGWYRLFHASLFSMRMLSACAGLGALLCWYFVAKKLAGSGTAVLLTSLAAIDTSFVLLAGTGRSDMLSLALGAAAQASYLALRETKLPLATTTAHALVVASGLTHPDGGLIALASVVILQVQFDRKRLRVTEIAAAALPYFAGALAWGSYIAQAPDLFAAQFGGNSGERLWPWKMPLLALRREIVDRYIGGYTLGSAWSRLAELRLLILAAYLAGLAAVGFIAPLRRSVLGKLALTQAGAIAAILWFFEGAKQPWYLIYLVFPLTAALAISIRHLWPSHRRVLLVAVAAFAALQIAYPALLIAQNKYRRIFLPLTAQISTDRPERPLVMGTAELGFGLGFDSVIDDYRLGYFTGKRPEYIVIDPRYKSYLDDARVSHPEIQAYAVQLIESLYSEIYSNGYYTLYQQQMR
jgi:uncharacterized membrane protein